jgi:hypothetical protein
MERKVRSGDVSGDGDVYGAFGDNDGSEDSSTGLDFCARDSCAATVDAAITGSDDQATTFGPSPAEGAVLVGSDNKKKKKRGKRSGKQKRPSGDQRKAFSRTRYGDTE